MCATLPLDYIGCAVAVANRRHATARLCRQTRQANPQRATCFCTGTNSHVQVSVCCPRCIRSLAPAEKLQLRTDRLPIFHLPFSDLCCRNRVSDCPLHGVHLANGRRQCEQWRLHQLELVWRVSGHCPCRSDPKLRDHAARHFVARSRLSYLFSRQRTLSSLVYVVSYV